MLTSRRQLLRAVTRHPVVVKPVRGHRGVGVRVLRTPASVREIPALAGARGPVPPGLLLQDHVEGPGEDLKVYVVAERVWAVRKPFSPTSFSKPGRPVAVTPEVERLALRCGAATRLRVFGIDVIEGARGPVVVDLNYFPGYKGCEGVAAPLADLLDERVRRCRARR